LRLAGAANLKGKTIIDVSNPLDFSKGMPPSLHGHLSNTTSVGEEIQKAFPESKVVKTLNTVNCLLMVDASLVKGEHDIFVCGNDDKAKDTVKDILKNWFGWKSIVDLGDITGSRAVEMYLPLWVRLYGAFKSPMYNIHILR
jgi:predicted dinucleotide-binding enzyme